MWLNCVSLSLPFIIVNFRGDNLSDLRMCFLSVHFALSETVLPEIALGLDTVPTVSVVTPIED